MFEDVFLGRWRRAWAVLSELVLTKGVGVVFVHQRSSRYEGDLVAKCYYAKRKLVWEVLDSGLKSKVEIQWSDISAMKATCPDNLPGSLEIEVWLAMGIVMALLDRSGLAHFV